MKHQLNNRYSRAVKRRDCITCIHLGGCPYKNTCKSNPNKPYYSSRKWR